MRLLAILLPILLLWAGPSAFSQTAASDPKGVVVLQQTLAVSGAAANPVRSFVANGTITYFWAGQRVEGQATIRARGHEQFRIDADLPDGRRSLAVQRQGGQRKNASGKTDAVPVHNTLSGGIVITLPHAAISAALADGEHQIAYVGTAEAGGRAAHQVRVSRRFSAESDPSGLLSRLSNIDYFVDAETGLVVKTEDATHPIENLSEEYRREVEFERYTAVSGVAVPAVVREKIAGQTTWEFRLSSMTLNGNVAESEFLLE